MLSLTVQYTKKLPIEALGGPTLIEGVQQTDTLLPTDCTVGSMRFMCTIHYTQCTFILYHNACELRRTLWIIPT